ncbi:MAG: hypothetical protein HY458_02340 [Parcubacteria group bacterium]|nr:hypothetical protein [Parcubacteria group bacterium]
MNIKTLLGGVMMAGMIASSGLIMPPQTLDEAKGVVEQILLALPRAMQQVWNQELLPILNKVWIIARDLWTKYVWWRIEPELEKEKEELSRELQTELESQGGFQGLWERFKTLIP